MFEKSASLEEFNLFKKDILNKINSLQKNIEHTVQDSEEHINNIEEEAVESISNIKNKETEIKENLFKIENVKLETEKILANISDEYMKLKNKNTTLDTELEEVNKFKNEIINTKEEITSSAEKVQEKIILLEKALIVGESLPSDIENIKEITNKASELHNEIEALQIHSIDKKSKIDKLYNEIYGQNIENENGEIEHTNGLVDELKISYNELNNDLKDFDNTLNNEISDIKENFSNLLDDSKDEVNVIKLKLKELLPGAMASGLSSAYTEKTNDEKESKIKLESNFKLSIVGLIIVSLIPVSVDIYRLIMTDADLVQVIKDTPNLIISIFPIYFPILWFAYSSNKKLNLSKRLIEEYTHKAVLGNTFEGLSTQIETLDTNENIRMELRTKLLFNLLQVSSENPGKLITDYQTSDHPLMEALENSNKLSGSIDKLNKIPGFSAMAKKLSTKKDDLIKNTEKSIEEGLKNID